MLSWEEICKIKDEIQELGIQAWLAKAGHGTLQFFTGFGKTMSAIKIIIRLRTKNPNARVIVLVPTDDLYKQWITKNLDIEVYIYNSYIKSIWICDLLIIDEAHLINANTFKTALECTTYKWILCLTATFKRKDGKHSILQQYAPIVYSLNLEQGEKLGLLPKNQYINYIIDLNKEEKERYEEINKQFNDLFAYFEHDMKLMHSCMNITGAERYYERVSNLFEMSRYEGIRKLAEYAVFCNKAMKERESFVHKSNTKIKKCVELIKLLNLKTIVFGESNEITEEIAQRINVEYSKEISKAYHSNNAKKLNSLIYSAFKKGQIKFLISARKLIVGIDEPDIALGIDYSYTSSSIDNQQKRGRVLRIDEHNLNKVALYITFILRGTVEEKWSKSKSSEIGRIINVESNEEVVNILNNLTNK